MELTADYILSDDFPSRPCSISPCGQNKSNTCNRYSTQHAHKDQYFLQKNTCTRKNCNDQDSCCYLHKGESFKVCYVAGGNNYYTKSEKYTKMCYEAIREQENSQEVTITLTIDNVDVVKDIKSIIGDSSSSCKMLFEIEDPRTIPFLDAFGISGDLTGEMFSVAHDGIEDLDQQVLIVTQCEGTKLTKIDIEIYGNYGMVCELSKIGCKVAYKC